jgi:hypothetical protein
MVGYLHYWVSVRLKTTPGGVMSIANPHEPVLETEEVVEQHNQHRRNRPWQNNNRPWRGSSRAAAEQTRPPGPAGAADAPLEIMLLLLLLLLPQDYAHSA